jgi:hypothetical protein
MTGVQFPIGARIFLLAIMSRLALEPTQPPIQWIQGALCPIVKQLSHETDNSPASSAEVKTVWSSTSTHPRIFVAQYLIKHRNIFTFTLYSTIIVLQSLLYEFYLYLPSVGHSILFLVLSKAALDIMSLPICITCPNWLLQCFVWKVLFRTYLDFCRILTMVC